MVFTLCESLSVSFENRSQQTLCCLGNEPINLFWNLFIWPNFRWYILILHGTRTQSIFSHLNPILTRTHAIYLRLNSILVLFQFSRSKINLVFLFYYRRLWIMFSAHHHQSLSIMPKSMSCLFVCFFGSYYCEINTVFDALRREIVWLFAYYFSLKTVLKGAVFRLFAVTLFHFYSISITSFVERFTLSLFMLPLLLLSLII